MNSSKIQLETYFIEKLLLEWKDGSIPPNPRIPITIGYNFGRHKTIKNKYRLDFMLMSQLPQDVSGVMMDIKIAGFFSFPEEIDEATLIPQLINNGTSILYSTLRGHIDMLTSNFPCGRIILPPVVMADVFQKAIEKTMQEKWSGEAKIKK